MKYSAAISLAIAPVALAKAVQNVYPHHRRSPKEHLQSAARQLGSVGGSINEAEAAALALTGLRSGTDVIVIWVNQGGGAATQTVNAPVTVTTTVTANGGGGQVAPPAATGAPPPPAGGAGTATPPQAGTGVAAGAMATHTVTVGGPKGLQFEPNDIKAAVGDMVVFTFLSQNHTVTQSAFDTPCQPLSGGMDSGFQPNANNSINPPPQVAMQVMVDTPLWFYCRQMGHCGKGMAMSINPTAAKTQAMFQSMAIQQAGAGGGSAITGNGGGAAPPAGGASSAAAPPAEGATSLAPLGESATAVGGASATLAPLGGESATGAASPQGTGGVTTGQGTLQADGSCACVVQCAAGSFPAVQAQGVGAFGGQGGSVPASMVGLR